MYIYKYMYIYIQIHVYINIYFGMYCMYVHELPLTYVSCTYKYDSSPTILTASSNDYSLRP